MKTSKRVLLAALLGALLILALSAGAAPTDGGPTIERWLLGSGGGPTGNGAIALNGSFGQPIIGSSTHNDVAMQAGFWQKTVAGYDIYLPLTLRGN